MDDKAFSQGDDWNMNGEGGFKNVNGNNIKYSLHDGIPKYQLVRLILDSLDSMGYSKTVETLENESEIHLESKNIKQLRSVIEKGQFHLVDNIITQFNLKEHDYNMIQYYIARHKYLESLENNNISEALSIMRNEIISLNIDQELIQQLSSLLLIEPNEIYEKAKWSGIKGDTRNTLFNDIYKHLNCDEFFDRGRLHELIKQSIMYQKMKLPKHFQSNIRNINLFKDLESPNFPGWKTKEILYGHDDEVWGLSYSYDGKFLASHDSKGIVIVWNVSSQNYTIFTKIDSVNGESVENIDWNQDNRRLLICTKQLIIVYDIIDSQVKMKYNIKNATSSAWVHKKECFLTGDQDGNLNLVEYKENINNNNSNDSSHQDSMELETDNNIIYTWKLKKINDISVSMDGKHATILDQDQSMYWIDIDTQKSEYKFFGGYYPITCSISDNNLLLINFSNKKTPFIGAHESQIIKVFDIEKDKTIEVYKGYKQTRYFIRSTFGGKDNQYILSGSEDTLIYVWFRPTNELLCTLKGHTSVVNSVSWNNYDNTFASCSDDGTIRIWIPE